MIQFCWIEYDLVAVAFQSPHNLSLLDLLNYATIYGIMLLSGSGETSIGTKKFSGRKGRGKCGSFPVRVEGYISLGRFIPLCILCPKMYLLI